MNMNEVTIEALKSKTKGMHVLCDNGVRVTHNQMGIVVEIPHGTTTSQAKNIAIALDMLDTAME